LIIVGIQGADNECYDQYDTDNRACNTSLLAFPGFLLLFSLVEEGFEVPFPGRPFTRVPIPVSFPPPGFLLPFSRLFPILLLHAIYMIQYLGPSADADGKPRIVPAVAAPPAGLNISHIYRLETGMAIAPGGSRMLPLTTVYRDAFRRPLLRWALCGYGRRAGLAGIAVRPEAAAVFAGLIGIGHRLAAFTSKLAVQNGISLKIYTTTG